MLTISVDTVTTARRSSSISRSAFEDGAPWPRTRRRAEEGIDSRDRQQLPRTEEKGRHGSSITEVGKVAVSHVNDLHDGRTDARTHERTHACIHARTHARMVLRDEILNTKNTALL